MISVPPGMLGNKNGIRARAFSSAFEQSRLINQPPIWELAIYSKIRLVNVTAEPVSGVNAWP